MTDSYEHEKPYSLTAAYQEIPAPSPLTAPYDLHTTHIVRTASSGSVILVEI